MPSAARVGLLVLLCLGLTAGQAWAAVQIEQGRDQEECRLEVQAAILDDPSGKLGIEEVSSSGMQARFHGYTGSLLNFTGATGRKWLRISIRCNAKPEAASGGWVLELGLPDRELIQLYGPYTGKPGSHRLLDSSYDSRRVRRMPYPRYAHSLLVRPQEWTTYYVRVEPFGPTVCSLILWQEELFFHNALINILLFGMLFGIMFCMTCYNLFLFLSLKRNIYLVYVIYIFSILCYVLILDGYAGVLLEASHLELKVFEWTLLGISIIFATWFCQKFLDTRRFTPRWHWLMVFFQLMAMFVIVLGLIGEHDAAAKLATMIGLIGPVFLLIVGIIRWRQGYGAAKFYLLASLAFVLGTMFFLLWTLDVLPQRLNGELLFTLGPTIESVLFSFALADRIRSLENDKLVLAQSQAHYKKASQIDGLTELFNKTYFMHCLDRLADGAGKTGHPLAFAILDIDDFKLFNDNHGHQVGDDVLRSMGRVIRNELRGPDIAGRYGGEEFTLAFPNSTAAQASYAVERIRKSFASQVFQTSDSQPDASATLSLGLAQIKQGESSEALIKRADQALYKAKSSGKNQVIIAS